MTKEEKQRFDNLKYKFEKLQARFDELEQKSKEEAKELKSKVSLLEKENKTLNTNNDKLEKVCLAKCNELYNEIANVNKLLVEETDKKKQANKTIEKLNKQIEILKATVLDLKNAKKKDSSNSSKPSSANQFKKVVQNNRVKSGKSKGGQKGRIGKTLNLVTNPDVIEEVYGEQTCECGGKIIYECESIKRQVIDILNEVKTIEYRIHKGVCQKCGREYVSELAKDFPNPVQYSDNIKLLVPTVKNTGYMSVVTTKDVFSILFNGFNPSIGWVHEQDIHLAKMCKPVYEKIKEYLINSNLCHSDETFLKVEDKLGACITVSNEKAVIYDIFKNKSKESFDEMEIFQNFQGILVHDHNKTYYQFLCIEHAECNVHILRYLKYSIETCHFVKAKELREFLLDVYKEKTEAIARGETGFSEERLKEIKDKYLQILNEWEKEYNEAVKEMKTIPKIYTDSKNLFTRLREYEDNHLLFVKDFKVPFSNNAAERNLRKLKIKMNISKRFGQLQRGKEFAIILSIIETSKLQGLNPYEVLKKIQNGNNDVFDLTTNTQELAV